MSVMGATEERSFNGLSPPELDNLISVKDFFKGKDVFITGALGFMGKILVEKLLWECDNIGNLYVLVRDKKAMSANKRLEDMFASPVFDRIKKKDPSLFSKVLPISGDLSELELGMSPEDRSLIEQRVCVVIHAASTVRFDEPIKKAVLLNVRGTRDVVNLCKTMKNLKAMVYVSTAYSNTSKPSIEETVLTTQMDWKNIIKFAEDFDENTFNILTAKVIGNHPNTYTFSKQMAEAVVYEHRYEIPTIIYRPSIVTYSLNEPFPGWFESLNGPIGICIGAMHGVLHVLYGNCKNINNYIHCDYAINGLIATAWYRGIVKNNECVAINAASEKNNKSFTIEDINVAGTDVIWDVPPNNMLWYPWIVITENRYLYTILVWVAHLLPAVLIDVALRIKGVKFRMLTLYRRIYIANNALFYFTTNDWPMVTDNFKSLKSLLLPEDKVNFFYEHFFDLYISFPYAADCTKRFFLKEDMSESALKRAKKKLSLMYWMDRIVRGAVVAAILWMTYLLIQKYTRNVAITFLNKMI